MRTLTFIVTLFLCLPGNAAAYEWSARDGFAGWRFSNVSAVQPTEEGVRIFKQADGSEFSFSLPGGTVGAARVVNIRLRTMGTEAQMACVYTAGPNVRYQVLPIFDGKKWKELSFDFTGVVPSRVQVDSVTFVSDSSAPVEIKDISIHRQSFSDLLVPQGLRAFHVNSLPPFLLFGHSLNLWCYGAILVASICITLFLFLKKKRGTLFLTGAVFLLCFLLISVRETFEDFEIIDTTYRDFLSAPPGEKRYHYLSDLIDFSAFVTRTMPLGEKNLYVFSDDYDYLYLKYLLYPLRLVQRQKGDNLGRVNIFYHVGVEAEANWLMENGQAVARMGRTIAYTPTSFLYLQQ